MLSENRWEAAIDPRRKVGCEAGAEITLAWGRHLSPDDVVELRYELIQLIQELASLSGWTEECADNVLYRACCSSLGDLLPDLHHFRERVATARADMATRALLKWALRMDGFDDWGQT
ncbi:hypothetical protein [Paraburkholderia saeva]|uniref:hypothetical protein n=1 Tax=Paraburkholderia saeva TaxID=2777537 RepID=UPI001DFCFA62|nr:hypothetical protein [Paraburkholderia saeva]CAG4908390.1 hypothetical protein R52603_03623 [Paraburkholderia saeva]